MGKGGLERPPDARHNNQTKVVVVTDNKKLLEAFNRYFGTVEADKNAN